MAGSLKASFILKLEDQLSGGLGKLTKMLSSLSNLTSKLTLDPLSRSAGKLPGVAQSIGALSRALEGVGTAAGRAEAMMGRMWNRAKGFAGTSLGRLRGLGERIGPIGGAVAGVSVLGPIEHWSEMSNMLRHIAITEKLTGPAVETEISRLRKKLYTDALESGQSSRSIAKAYLDLVQMGIPSSVLDTVITAHSRAATAYNILPEDLGPAVGSLIKNLRVPEDEIGGALAAMALASKEGRFKVSDFSREVPGVFGQMAAWHMFGRDAANQGFAALQTVMMNTSIPSQAATDFSSSLRNLSSPAGQKYWQNATGFQLLPFLERARNAGISPLEAVLAKLRQFTSGMSPEKARGFMSKVFHAQEAGDAWLSLLQHVGDYISLRDKLRVASAGSLNDDFITAMRDPIVQVRTFKELLSQLGDTLGRGFVPALQFANIGLLHFTGFVQSMEERFPRATEATLSMTAALGSLLAVLGIVGVIGPAVKGGGALLAPLVSLPGMIIGATAATFAGVGWYVWNYWDDLAKAVDQAPIFSKARWTQWWEGQKQATIEHWDTISSVLSKWSGWASTWASGLGTDLLKDLNNAYGPVVKFFEDLWAKCSAPFSAAMDTINNALRLLGLTPNSTAAPALAPAGAPAFGSQWSQGSEIPAPPWRLPQMGEVMVRFINAPAGMAVDTNNPWVRVQVEGEQYANRGRALEREGRRDY